MQELLANQELLWLLTVVYDLGLAILLYRFFGKYGRKRSKMCWKIVWMLLR